MERRLTRRFASNLPGWEVEETIEDGPGSNSSRRYFYRGRLAIRTELTTKVARRLAGLTLIDKDIRNMLAWTAALGAALRALGSSEKETIPSLMPLAGEANQAQPTIVIARGLYLALVTTYGKLFAGTDGRGVNLERKAHVEPQHLEIHDYLIETRNQFAAHAGVGFEGCCVVRAVATDDDSKELKVDTFTELHQPTFPGLPELARMQDLLQQLRGRVASSHDRCSKALRRDEASG